MTEEEIKQAGIDYSKKFTAEQIESMKKRIHKRIFSGETFKFGPEKNSQLEVKFVKTAYKLKLNTVDGINITFWSKWHTSNEIAQAMFEMCAFWDIIMKNYYNDIAKSKGLKP